MFYFMQNLETNVFWFLSWRNKAGIWGWRSDKSEMINGHECKVFSASNVELITKTRLEHLSEADKVRARTPRTPLQSFLGIAEQQQQDACSTTTSVISNLKCSNFISYKIWNERKNCIYIWHFRKSLLMLAIPAIFYQRNILIPRLICTEGT